MHDFCTFLEEITAILVIISVFLEPKTAVLEPKSVIFCQFLIKKHLKRCVFQAFLFKIRHRKFEIRHQTSPLICPAGRSIFRLLLR